MKREFLTTGDGSITIHLPEWNEQYHSRHGAIAEANHVFIDSGLKHWFDERGNDAIAILEMGFGTGLNALLTRMYAQLENRTVHYTGVEAFPVSSEEINSLNYTQQLDASGEMFTELHGCPWGKTNALSSTFSITKRQQDFTEVEFSEAFDLIYFDAFGPRVQPELWTLNMFERMFRALKFGGVLVTYSAKGSVRRNMLAAGFVVERLPGPPGKREMLRASKSNA